MPVRTFLPRRASKRFRPKEGMPASLSGHTLIWREMFGAHGDVNAGNPRSFTSVTNGIGYARGNGPRDSTFPAVRGWSMRLPPRTFVAGNPVIVFNAYKDFAAQNIIQFSGWFRFQGAGQGRSYVLRVLNGSTYLFSVTVEWTTFGSQDITIKMDDSTNGASGSAIVRLNEGLWLALVAETPDLVGGTGTKIWRVYYRRVGDAVPTLLSTQSIVSTGAVYVPNRVEVHAAANELSLVDPWYGSVGGLNLISCDILASAALYPPDMLAPREVVNNWFIDAVNGNDSNDGMTSTTAWLTYNKLWNELRNSTFNCADDPWTDGMLIPKSVTTITNKATKDIWEAAYDLNDRLCVGDKFNLVSSTPLNALPGSGNLNLENSPGIVGDGLVAGAGISAVLNLTGVVWTRPNAATAPNVWKYTATNLEESLVKEAGRLMTPKPAVNEAAALPLLQAMAGTCYANSTGIYIHPFNSGNPNDAIVRSCGFYVLQGGTGAGLVASGNNLLKNMKIDTGPNASYTGASAPSPTPSYTTSGVTGTISVWDNVTLYGGNFHTNGFVGNGLNGFGYRKNITYESCYIPAGTGNFSVDVTYSSLTTGTGSICSKFKNCSSKPGAAYHFPGELVSDNPLPTFYLTHSNAGRTLPLFSISEFENCTLQGFINFSLHANFGVLVVGTKYDGMACDSFDALFKKVIFTQPPNIYSGSTFIQNGIFVASNVVLGDAGLIQQNATLALDRCTLDVRNYNFAANGNAIFRHIGLGSINFEMVNTAIWHNSLVNITKNTIAADITTMDHCAFLGPGIPQTMINHNDGTITKDRNYDECIALGHITNPLKSTSIGLNSANNYDVFQGSPVINMAVEGVNVEDWTGNIFLSRKDIGAREFIGTIGPTIPANARILIGGDYRIIVGGDYRTHI